MSNPKTVYDINLFYETALNLTKEAGEVYFYHSIIISCI